MLLLSLKKCPFSKEVPFCATLKNCFQEENVKRGWALAMLIGYFLLHLF